MSLDLIEVVPEDGIYYDNSILYTPEKKEGTYYYFDEDGDGRYSTIFIVDSEDEVLGIGFDYDGNSYFCPNKLLLVEKHIIESKASGYTPSEYTKHGWIH